MSTGFSSYHHKSVPTVAETTPSSSVARLRRQNRRYWLHNIATLEGEIVFGTTLLSYDVRLGRVRLRAPNPVAPPYWIIPMGGAE